MNETVSAPSRLLRMVIVGHVDHGKSTLVGRLMADTDSLPAGKLELVRDICDRQGKTFEFAFLLDALEEEQEQGITIDTSQIFFKTEKRNYVIIDAPGHKEFLKNMVTGAASAEAALLLIDAYEGVQEQTRRHGYILKLLGLTQVAVVINKMDLTGYNPEVYFRIKNEYSDFLKSLGVEARHYIPVAAKHGVNIARRAQKEMPWYPGPSVLEMLDQFENKVPKHNLPFRMPVQDVYKFDQRRIVAGRVESGRMRVGDKVVFSPSNKTGIVKTIEKWSVPSLPEEVSAAQSVGFTLTEQLFVERGELVSLAQEPLPILSSVFDANVFWMGKRHLEKGRPYLLKLTTQEIVCEVLDFKKVIDASTLETLPSRDYIVKNDVAELTLRTKYPVAFDTFLAIPETGRFVIVDEYDVCGGGIITSYTPTDSRDKLLQEARYRDFNWVSSNITAEQRAYRNGHRAALILITGNAGVGKARIARLLEEKLFHSNFQSYLLDGHNVRLGVGADIESEEYFSEGEAVRRYGEVAKLFLDAGHVVISTSNVFNQEDHSAIRLLVEPCPVVDILVSNTPSVSGDVAMTITPEEAKKAEETVTRIFNYLKEQKILIGHNYSI